MPELARTIVSRLRAFVGNRRRNRRKLAKLPFSVTPADRRVNSNGSARIAWLDGCTRDVSFTGLGLIVPAIRIGEHYLVGDSRKLLLKVELPTGPVEMIVGPLRYEALEEDDTETGYVIGVEILEIKDDRKSQYEDFVHRLMNLAPLD